MWALSDIFVKQSVPGLLVNIVCAVISTGHNEWKISNDIFSESKKKTKNDSLPKVMFTYSENSSFGFCPFVFFLTCGHVGGKNDILCQRTQNFHIQ